MRVVRALACLLLCVVGGPVLATAGDDRIHVYYPRAECFGDRVEVEVWDRARESWRAHPEHGLVPVESCQVESAGVLLHEIRWRCYEPDREPAWHVGLDVFDPAISQSCEVGPVAAALPSADIHIASPFKGAVVKWKKGFALVDGSVRIDGVEGVQYELALALDRSGTGEQARRRLDAQVLAARSFVAAHAKRLGDLRIGVVAFPGTKSDARIMTLPTSDLRTLDRALGQVARLGTSGSDAFSDGLAAALDLVAPADDKPARPRARPVVVIAADGANAPFVHDATRPSYALRANELAERARKAGVRLHLFALAGHAEAASPLARGLAERAHGSVRRVPAGAFDNAFFAAVKLPLPKAVTIYNPRTQETTRARLDANGRFRASVPMEAGENPLQVVATTTSQSQGETQWNVRYDASAARDAFLAGERERIRRVRARKKLEISVGPDELAARSDHDLPAPGALDERP
jgi:hypothetical protein